MKHLYYTNPINENYRIALERSHACDTIVDFRICVYPGNLELLGFHKARICFYS